MTRSRRKFKFSKAFVGRIAAVGLFVCLGSFAVVQSIRQAQKNKDDSVSEAEHDHEHADSETPKTEKTKGVPGALTADDVQQISAKPASFNQETTEPVQGNGSAGIPKVDSLPTVNGESQFGTNTNTLPGNNELPPLINSDPGLPTQGAPNTGNQFGNDSQFGSNGMQSPPPQTGTASPANDKSVGNTLPTNGSFNPAGNNGGQKFALPNQTLPNQSLPNQSLPNNQLDTGANSKIPALPNNDPFGNNPAIGKQPPTDNTSSGSNTFPPIVPSNDNTFPSNPALNGNTGQSSNQSGNMSPIPTLPNNQLDSNTLPGQLPSNSDFPPVVSEKSDSNELPGTNGNFQAGNQQTGNQQSGNQQPFVNDLRNGGGNFGTTNQENNGGGQINLPSNQDFKVDPVDPAANSSLPTPIGNFGGQDSTSAAPVQPISPAPFPNQSLNDTQSGNQVSEPQKIGTNAAPFPNGTQVPAKNVSLTKEVIGLQSPSLTLQKIAPREVTVNQETTFQLIVRNVGQTRAENVTVHDRIPANVQIVDLDPQPENNQSGRVAWNLGTMEPNSVKRIRMKLKPVSAGEINSVAQVTFTARAGSSTKITKPQLKIYHQAAAKTLIGRDVLMQITVENTGDGPARNVVIQEKVPSNFKFLIGNREEKEIEYAIGTLGPGQKRDVTLRLRAHQIGKSRNHLLARADGELRAQHEIDLSVVAPNLGVEARGPRKRFLGRPAEHEFTVKNTGSAAATNVDLIAKLPRGLRFASANHHGQYNPGNHTVVWSLERLEPGVMGKVKLTTTPMQNGNQTIEFISTADLGQKESAESTMLVYQVAELYFDIKDETDALEVGTETVYNVRVVNQGSKAANNVSLSVQFGPGIKPIQIDGAPANQAIGQMVTLPKIQTLGPKQQRTFRIRARGVTAGEHRIVASMASDERAIAVKKEESTHVYSDN